MAVPKQQEIWYDARTSRGEFMSRKRMSRKFNRILAKALQPENRVPFNLDSSRLVIFSDHHKGDGSPADDFAKNAALYGSALSSYKDKGFRLIVLGDNEELWENRYDQILPRYQELIAKEVRLAVQSPAGRKIRIWGNHDKEVSGRRFRRRLERRGVPLFKEVEHREGLCLGEEIFLVHGHQGRFFEDIAWRLSRWAVKFIWKTVQKIFHIGIDGPAENFRIRDDLEMNYYAWAKEKGILLICGHTHRAIFGSRTHYDSLQADLTRLEKYQPKAPAVEQPALARKIAEKKSRLEGILARRLGVPPKSFESPPQKPVPCYFNDGCGVYTNGITCLEIDRGFIRLVKWQKQDKTRRVLARANLKTLVMATKARIPYEVLEREEED